jgi:hypothetical protein
MFFRATDQAHCGKTLSGDAGDHWEHRRGNAQWADTAGRVTDETSYAAAIDKVFGAAARDRILRLYPASNMRRRARPSPS